MSEPRPPRFTLQHRTADSTWGIYDSQERTYVLSGESYGVAVRVEARLNGTDRAGWPGCAGHGEPEETADDYLHAFPTEPR